ncbi:hypothetical protein LTS18_011905 [Coniosporium uncinatum]|uniref:Uncharacterized protein n=1 Tax=Coniosporium uncinatum TaxID=93489 RepID=A0ACC3DCT3_9PEZI|nr:hypothetical protein LTS18_011905 [Coniosporium uncinatum]
MVAAAQDDNQPSFLTATIGCAPGQNPHQYNCNPTLPAPTAAATATATTDEGEHTDDDDDDDGDDGGEDNVVATTQTTPAAAVPVTTDPATIAPTSTDLATTDAATINSTATDLATTDAATIGPTATDPGPTATDPATTDPAVTSGTAASSISNQSPLMNGNGQLLATTSPETTLTFQSSPTSAQSGGQGQSSQPTSFLTSITPTKAADSQPPVSWVHESASVDGQVTSIPDSSLQDNDKTKFPIAAVLVPLALGIAAALIAFLLIRRRRRRRANPFSDRNVATAEMKMKVSSPASSRPPSFNFAATDTSYNNARAPIISSTPISPPAAAAFAQTSGGPTSSTSPVLLSSRMPHMGGAYYTGIDTSDALSTQRNSQVDDPLPPHTEIHADNAQAYAYDHEIEEDEPPPPYRPRSVPSLSRDSSIRTAEGMVANGMAPERQRLNGLSSPFDDPEDDEEEEDGLSMVSAPLNGRREDDGFSVVSLSEYQGPMR